MSKTLILSWVAELDKFFPGEYERGVDYAILHNDFVDVDSYILPATCKLVFVTPERCRIAYTNSCLRILRKFKNGSN